MLRRVIAATSVLNQQADLLLALDKRECRVLRLGMTGDIGQTLLGDAKEGRFIVWRQTVRPVRDAIGMQLDVQVQTLLAIFDQPAERRQQPKIVENAGSQLLREDA